MKPARGIFALVLVFSGLTACRNQPTRPPDEPPSPPPSPSSIAIAPLGKGQMLLSQNCQSCHGPDLVTQQRLTAGQWTGVVKKMRGWGSPLEEENEIVLSTYLAENYGVASPPPSLVRIDAAAVSAAIAGLSDGKFAGGNVARGNASYAKACAPCHGPDAEGALLGVKLRDIPLLYRASEIEAVVRTGRGRMPAFDSEFTDQDLSDVLAFLRAPSVSH